MQNNSRNVFVSYSHDDMALVQPVVRLLRINSSLVFHDIDNIKPGKQWRNEIENAITNSHLVIVFWCEHASKSAEVQKEWQAALQQNKDLLPLLLDSTPLPPELKRYQWIDFQEATQSHRQLAQTSQRKGRILIGLIVCIVISVLGVSGTLRFGGSNSVVERNVDERTLKNRTTSNQKEDQAIDRTWDSLEGPEFFESKWHTSIVEICLLLITVSGAIYFTIRAGKYFRSDSALTEDVYYIIAKKIETKVLERVTVRQK